MEPQKLDSLHGIKTTASKSQLAVDHNVNIDGDVPLTFRVPWETDAYVQILRNAIEWGVN